MHSSATTRAAKLTPHHPLHDQVLKVLVFKPSVASRSHPLRVDRTLPSVTSASPFWIGER